MVTQRITFSGWCADKEGGALRMLLSIYTPTAVTWDLLRSQGSLRSNSAGCWCICRITFQWKNVTALGYYEERGGAVAVFAQSVSCVVGRVCHSLSVSSWEFTRPIAVVTVPWCANMEPSSIINVGVLWREKGRIHLGCSGREQVIFLALMDFKLHSVKIQCDFRKEVRIA